MTWQDEGRCAETDGDLFFADGKGGHTAVAARKARAICASCEVRAECLAYAMAQTDLHGIWAGTTMQERALAGAAYTDVNRRYMGAIRRAA